MIKKFSITIPTLSDEERVGYIYLPPSYETDTDTNYPVMYMFDGQNIFFDEDATYKTSWGLSSYLEDNPVNMIIIAISSSTIGNNRLYEYTPYVFTYNGENIIAKGKIYMDWLINDLKPQVDDKLRTLKDRNHTYICGSSLGGLMSFYGATLYNKYFSKAICLSPSLWVNVEGVIRTINTSKMNENTCIYMDYGSKELDNHVENKDILAEATALLIKKNINATLTIAYGGKHCEASWAKRVPYIMKWLDI